MSIGASEHRAFVRAKARFAGPKGSGTHFVHRNAVFTGHIAMYRWRHFHQSRSSRRHRTASGSSLRPVAAGCEPIPTFLLQPGPPTCPAWPSAASVAARCEPFSVNSLPPGLPSCLATASAPSAFARYEPFSENRLTPAPRDSGFRPGTMAAGAREQAASCDAFVLSRRPPAPGAPSNRTSTACLVAKPSPNHGPVSG